MSKYVRGKSPNEVKNQFKTDRKESCTAQINIKIPPSMKNKLKNIDGWHEDVRRYLEELIKTKSA